MFTTHFAGSHPHQTTTLSLLSVRQEQDVTMRAFIDRFSKAALCTPNLNQEMILQCMALTLKPGPFANNVYLHPPRLHAQTQAPCRGLHPHGSDAKPPQQVLQWLHPSTTGPDKPPPQPNSRLREPRQPCFTSYALLSVPRSWLLDEALHADLIPPPRKTFNLPMPTWPSIVDTTKIMVTLQTNAKRSKTKSKNWFALATFAILSTETDPRIHHGLITDIPLAILNTIITPINPTAKNHNLPALTSTRLIHPMRHNQYHLKGLCQWQLHLISQEETPLSPPIHQSNNPLSP